MPDPTPDVPRTWCAYVRVSRVGDRDGDRFHSPAQQETEIRGSVPGEVEEVFTDLDVSGTTFARAGRDRMAARGTRAARIAAYDLSCAGRNVRDALAFVDDVEGMGAGLMTVNERFDTTTPEGRLVLTNFLALHEFYSRNVGRRWRSVQQRRVAAGRPHGGGPRFGYRRNPETGAFEPDPATGPLLRDAYLAFIRGAGSQPVAKTVNDAGVRTAWGYEWSAVSVLRILDTGFAAGLLHLQTQGEIHLRFRLSGISSFLRLLCEPPDFLVAANSLGRGVGGAGYAEDAEDEQPVQLFGEEAFADGSVRAALFAMVCEVMPCLADLVGPGAGIFDDELTEMLSGEIDACVDSVDEVRGSVRLVASNVCPLVITSPRA